MSDCQHHWVMTNVKYGFVIFEKCYHCKELRTYFTEDDSLLLGDEYREGEHFYNRLESAQSFTFDLLCTRCNRLETYNDLIGLFYCTSCMPNCQVEKLQQQYAPHKTWIMVAFGILPNAKKNPIPQAKLDILSDYFNQRRDTTRSTIKIVSFELIADLTRCKGGFIHDVGLLTKEGPSEERKPLF